LVPEHFLTDTSALIAGDAVAALMVAEDGRYLLQLRDDIPGIFYPGHWGCFGGAVSPGEQPGECLQRELEEELEFRPGALTEFIRFDFDLSRIGAQHKVYRIYFEIPVTQAQVASFVLHEGADLGLFSAADIFARSNVTPYDSFALWLHVARRRFGTGRRVG